MDVYVVTMQLSLHLSQFLISNVDSVLCVSHCLNTKINALCFNTDYGYIGTPPETVPSAIVRYLVTI